MPDFLDLSYSKPTNTLVSGTFPARHSRPIIVEEPAKGNTRVFYKSMDQSLEAASQPASSAIRVIAYETITYYIYRFGWRCFM
jgi:hypothetical protein